jgi:hypothetical protein
MLCFGGKKMRKIKKTLIILSIVIGVALGITACGNDDDSDARAKKRDQKEPAENVTLSPSGEKNISPTEEGLPTDDPVPTDEPSPAPINNNMMCEKVASIDLTGKTFDTCVGDGVCTGFIYRTDGKYGYINSDGTIDTGAVFTSIKHDYNADGIVISSNAAEIDGSIASVNRYGLLSNEGKAIIPEEYFTFVGVNNQYVYAIKAIEETMNKDECMVYLSKGSLSLGTPGTDDIMYKGEWVLFDRQKGTPVAGATGTNPKLNRFSACPEGTAKFVTDDGVQHVIDANGEELNAKAVLFRNGSYSISDIDTATVFGADGKVLFTYDPNEYAVEYRSNWSLDGGYFAKKREIESDKYILLNI